MKPKSLISELCLSLTIHNWSHFLAWLTDLPVQMSALWLWDGYPNSFQGSVFSLIKCQFSLVTFKLCPSQFCGLSRDQRSTPQSRSEGFWLAEAVCWALVCVHCKILYLNQRIAILKHWGTTQLMFRLLPTWWQSAAWTRKHGLCAEATLHLGGLKMNCNKLTSLHRNQYRSATYAPLPSFCIFHVRFHSLFSNPTLFGCFLTRERKKRHRFECGGSGKDLGAAGEKPLSECIIWKEINEN